MKTKAGCTVSGTRKACGSLIGRTSVIVSRNYGEVQTDYLTRDARDTGSNPVPCRIFLDEKKKMSFTDNTTGKYEWGTPQRFFDELNSEFNFTVDVCASEENAKCQKFYDKKANGLEQDWTGEVCWMNPPYGASIGMWLKKAYESNATVVCLVPSRTDNRWWHQWVMMADEIRFVHGRLKFKGAGDGAKFPSAIVIYKHSR